MLGRTPTQVPAHHPTPLPGVPEFKMQVSGWAQTRGSRLQTRAVPPWEGMQETQSDSSVQGFKGAPVSG